VKFVNSTGGDALPNPYTISVPAGGSALVYVPNVPGLADGKFSVVVDADQPMNTITNLLSSGPTTAASYQGFNQADTGTTFYVPSVYTDYVGLYDSTIVVQNAEAQNANVQVTYKNALGVDVVTESATIAPNAAFTFDQGTSVTLPGGFVGSAVVLSDKAVAASFFISDPVNGQFSSSNGFKEGSSIAYLPVVYNEYSADRWVTSFLVQNVGGAPALIEVQYSDGRTATATVPAGSSKLYYQGNDGTPIGFNGSAVVRSTNGQPIVAVANIRNDRGNLSAYNGFTSGATTIDLPAIYNNYSSLGWTTSFTVQNVDSFASNVTATFSNGQTKTVSALAPGQSALFYQPNDGIPNGFNGGVTVRSTGARVVAVVNELSLAPTTGGDWLLTYNAFNRT
jgi:hypothetical protein